MIIQTDTKAEIKAFNFCLEESLNGANFAVDGEPRFENMYLEDAEDDHNAGMHHGDEANTPTDAEYDDMHMYEWPDDDKEAIDQYLNIKLIMDIGTNNERCGCVIKCAKGLDSESIGCAHANPPFDTHEYKVEFMDGTRDKYQVNRKHVCSS